MKQTKRLKKMWNRNARCKTIPHYQPSLLSSILGHVVLPGNRKLSALVCPLTLFFIFFPQRKTTLCTSNKLYRVLINETSFANQFIRPFSQSRATIACPRGNRNSVPWPEKDQRTSRPSVRESNIGPSGRWSCGRTLRLGLFDSRASPWCDSDRVTCSRPLSSFQKASSPLPPPRIFRAVGMDL